MKLKEAYKNCMPCQDCDNASPTNWQLKGYKTNLLDLKLIVCGECGAAYEPHGKKIEYNREITEIRVK